MRKADQDGLVPCILHNKESFKRYRNNWAGFIRSVFAPEQ
jgi:hypothetical protein